MSTNPSEIVADLEHQKHDIEAEVLSLRGQIEHSLERLATIEATVKGLVELYGNAIRPSPAPVVPTGEYRNKTIAEAAEAHLECLGRPERPRQLWEALLAGGLKSTSANPVNNLNTTLSSRQYKFVRSLQGKGWRLKQWGGDEAPRTDLK